MIEGLEFGDEVEAINSSSRMLDMLGIKTQIVLVHQGDNTEGGGPDDCKTVPGPATAIAAAASPSVGVVFTGHSHQQYNCTVTDPAGKPRTLIQGASFGRLLSVVDLKIDKRTRDVVRESTRSPTRSSSPPSRTTRRSRSPTRVASAPTSPTPVRRNIMQTMTLTGAQLKTVLEQQWQPQPDGSVQVRMLQISSTPHYSWSRSAPIGSKISDITVAGEPVTDDATYRVSVNNFLGAGGDGLAEFANGTDIAGGPVDLDAFTAYLTANPNIAPPPAHRSPALDSRVVWVGHAGCQGFR